MSGPLNDSMNSPMDDGRTAEIQANIAYGYSPHSRSASTSPGTNPNAHKITSPNWDFLDSMIPEDSDMDDLFTPDFQIQPMAVPGKAFIQVAQVVVDQAVTRSQSSKEPSLLASSPSSPSDPVSRAWTTEKFAEAIRNVFPMSAQCSLFEHAAAKEPAHIWSETVQDIHISSEKLFKLDPPYACVRRMGTKMDILPPAVHFWEELGLEPSHGRKDVLAFFLDPEHEEHLQRPIETFLKMMLSAYQSCNFGLHTTVTDNNDIYNEAQKRSYEIFGQRLAELEALDSTVVVYIMNNNEATATPPELCAIALSLLEGYRSVMGASRAKNSPDLVIQLVPKSMIFSSDHLVVPPLANYKKLALEVYDRCAPRQDWEKGLLCAHKSAPAICLSKSIPEHIDFRLSSDNSVASLDEDDCVHLAYAWPLGSNWLTASWTDNIGILRWNAAFWIGEDSDNPWQPFADAAREVLETTIDMLQPRSRSWRVFIAKAGRLSKYELDGESFQRLIREERVLTVDRLGINLYRFGDIR